MSSGSAGHGLLTQAARHLVVGDLAKTSWIRPSRSTDVVNRRCPTYPLRLLQSALFLGRHYSADTLGSADGFWGFSRASQSCKRSRHFHGLATPKLCLPSTDFVTSCMNPLSLGRWPKVSPEADNQHPKPLPEHDEASQSSESNRPTLNWPAQTSNHGPPYPPSQTFNHRDCST